MDKHENMAHYPNYYSIQVQISETNNPEMMRHIVQNIDVPINVSVLCLILP